MNKINISRLMQFFYGENMSWYKSGALTATNGSKTITGTGTQFTNPLNGVSAGRMLLLPAAGTVQIYEIESVQSDTQLTLVSAFTGTTGTGKAYAIPTSPAVSIEQFAHEFASTLAYYQQQLSGWQQILTGTGNVTLTTPDGQAVTVRSQQAWDVALDGKVTGVKQTGAFDATAGSLLINGAWGWGGSGQLSGITSDTDLLTYLRGANTPSSVLRLQYNSTYAKQNAASIYTRVNDMWSLISVGPHGSAGNSANGVRMSAGTTSGGQTVTYDVWTDKNLVKQTSQDDTTAGSVVLNGGHGLGANARPRAAGATGGAAGCGFFSYTAGNADNPFDGTGASGLHVQEAASYGWDLLGRDGGGIDFRLRQVSNGVASAWSTLWTSANLATPATLDTAQTISGAEIFTGGFQDLTTNLGRTTSPAPVALTSSAQLNALRNGGILFVNGSTSTASLMPGGSTSGYWFIVCIGKNDTTTNAAMIYAIQQGTPGVVYFGNLQTVGSVILDMVLTSDTAQTISGSKTFTANPVFQLGNPAAQLESTAVTEATVGRWAQFMNNSGVPWLLIRAGSGGATIADGQFIVTFPMATGTLLNDSSEQTISGKKIFIKDNEPIQIRP
ncbi:hypothetical protein [Candidatus Symbiopectobacterium endolongispinus]|uniref:hypothetical protein n=1 Tax=Candidatus Symbiopectobacterium endolongispinus TaxID=2812664 RepID=UPI0020798539|nr:hypothetical protein [Candidatus Symbiopectobacterium endolongispinus]MBT9430406.1 hypothetical protein [Candidatus Symbiopectobacterium endolongispinus]